MIIDFTNKFSPANNLIYELDYQLLSADIDSSHVWLAKDVTVLEALDILKTGLLDNKLVSKIKLFAIFDDSNSMEFIYDIQAAKKGNVPWTLEQRQLTVPLNMQLITQEL